MDCSLSGSSIHGIFQARVLEWGAIAFSASSAYLVLIVLAKRGKKYRTLSMPFFTFLCCIGVELTNNVVMLSGGQQRDSATHTCTHSPPKIIWHPTPVLLPGKSHGWRSLKGYSPWGCKKLDTTLSFSLFYHNM